MKKIIAKCNELLASLAWMMTSYSVNTACAHYMYQDELPKGAKKLRRF